MPTNNQIARNPRRPRFYKVKLIALDGCPQKKATCIKIVEASPRKPNSAVRKVAKIILTSNWARTWAYIPGEKQNLREHSSVLIRGGRTKDLPGMKYKVLRGKYDTHSWLTRFKSRSKYGVNIRRTREMKLNWPYFAHKPE